VRLSLFWTVKLIRFAVKRPKEKMSGTAEVAESYQYPTDNGRDGWFCHECRDWVWTVDIVRFLNIDDVGAKVNASTDLRLETLAGRCRADSAGWEAKL
jgi:hypothetical protein